MIFPKGGFLRYPLHLVSLLIVAPALLLGCGLKKTTEPTTPPTAPEAPQVSVDTSTAKAKQDENFQLAKSKAAIWYADSVFYQLQVKVGSQLDLSSGTETYVFGSPKDTGNWWTIAISQSSGKFIRAVIPKEDYLGADLSPAKLDFWKTSYGDALVTSEANGGQDFRAQNTISEVSITLSNGQPNGWLWWVVEYKGTGGETFKARVEPGTGTAYDEQGNPLNISPSASPQSP
jgi:hypothetical protein